MKCLKCGQEIAAGGTFCRQCSFDNNINLSALRKNDFHVTDDVPRLSQKEKPFKKTKYWVFILLSLLLGAILTFLTVILVEHIDGSLIKLALLYVTYLIMILIAFQHEDTGYKESLYSLAIVLFVLQILIDLLFRGFVFTFFIPNLIKCVLFIFIASGIYTVFKKTIWYISNKTNIESVILYIAVSLPFFPLYAGLAMAGITLRGYIGQVIAHILEII